MSVRLMREIRFALTHEDSPPRIAMNSWAGSPATCELVPYVVLRAVVSGSVQAKTGYVCNIKAIDRLLRTYAIPRMVGWSESGRCGGIPGVLQSIWTDVSAGTPDGVVLESLTLLNTPHLYHTIHRGEPQMVTLTYTFEFSAAHRLYCAELSSDENQRIFGPCTNPNGHGHNYVVRVTIKGEPDPQTGVVFSIPDFSRIVNERVIDRFDHKHLNEDCTEFARSNPTVENITRVIFDKLDEAFSPARLDTVRVYETPKTYAECGAVDSLADAK
jgi:6-pyruvoyltetrahydropterin/6-carboxytetrahydropterin synthase